MSDSFIAAIENNRQEEQIRLDLLKDAKERNRWGQFATPAALAKEIARYALRHSRVKKEPVTFLDPALGTGSFYSALRSTIQDRKIAHARGIEFDSVFAEAASNLWRSSGLTITHGDFTRQSPPPPGSRFNLILTNPPYVRHHHLGRQAKEFLRDAVRRRLDIRISGLAGFYCYFLLLCHDWLEDEGLAVWLIPSEFMDVNYGKAVRDYLTHHVRLIHIHRFSPEDVQFADALVTSAIVVFEKRVARASDSVSFSRGGSLLHPTHEEERTVQDLRTSERWNRRHNRTIGNAHATTPSLCFADLFSIKRGLATGSNRFFILPLEEARERGIPGKALRPILPSPRYLPVTIVGSRADGYAALNNPLALIDTCMTEDEVRDRHPGFWEYLAFGKANAIHQTYLTSRRSPWYSQENRPPPPFLCTYMGRNRAKGKSFRFIWNKSRATAANVYLLLYPRGTLKTALENTPALHEGVFEVLNGIATDELLHESRVYGGGLHKLEPRELGRLSAEPFLKVIKALAPARQMVLDL